MPQLTMYFFGLICHVGTNAAKPKTKDFALLVKDGGHKAFITNGPQRYDVTSDIQLTLAARGTATTTGLFHNVVPSLGWLFGQTLNAATVPGNAFKIDYPSGGTLSVVSLYKCEAEHRDKLSGMAKGPKRCIARINKVTGNVPANTILSFSTGSFTINQDTEILIGNAAKMTGPQQPCGQGTPMGHINAFKRILTGAPSDVEVYDLPSTGIPCPPMAAPGWVEAAILMSIAPDDSAPDDSDRAHPSHGGGVKKMTMTSTYVECGNTDLP